MNLWQLLLFVIIFRAVVAWNDQGRAAWIERALAWMFFGAFVSGAGMCAALDFLAPGVGIGFADLTSRAILGYGFVWAAWLAGGIVPFVYRIFRSRYALRARSAQTSH